MVLLIVQLDLFHSVHYDSSQVRRPISYYQLFAWIIDSPEATRWFPGSCTGFKGELAQNNKGFAKNDL